MFLDKQEDIESVLLLTQLQDISITVTLRGVDEVFTSTFEEIATEIDGRPTLLINPLSPSLGNKLVAAVRLMNIEFTLPDPTAKEKQNTYNFNANFIRKEKFEDKPVIRISFPEKRRYNRVVPRPDQPITLTVDSPSGPTSQYLVNVSEGGVGFYTNFDESELEKDKHLHIQLQFADGTQVDTKVVLRWISRFDTPMTIEGINYFCFCGAEFLEIEQDKLDYIIRYVHQRQEEQLQALINDESQWTDF